MMSMMHLRSSPTSWLIGMTVTRGREHAVARVAELYSGMGNENATMRMREARCRLRGAETRCYAPLSATLRHNWARERGG